MGSNTTSLQSVTPIACLATAYILFSALSQKNRNLCKKTKGILISSLISKTFLSALKRLQNSCLTGHGQFREIVTVVFLPAYYFNGNFPPHVVPYRDMKVTIIKYCHQSELKNPAIAELCSQIIRLHNVFPNEVLSPSKHCLTY